MATRCLPRKGKRDLAPKKVTTNFRLRDLAETGRLQFFFHSPISKLPVRDVTDEQGRGQKTEPHLEKRAENYVSECYQKNIVSFLNSSEKYLFLFTTCRNRNLGPPFYGRRFIIGYIVKKRALRRPNGAGHHYAVQGKTRIYSFEDALPLDSVVGETATHVRMRIFNENETGIVLRHFARRRNILIRCAAEIDRLKGELE